MSTFQEPDSVLSNQLYHPPLTYSQSQRLAYVLRTCPKHHWLHLAVALQGLFGKKGTTLEDIDIELESLKSRIDHWRKR